LALATHYFAVFVVAPEAVWLAIRERRRAVAAALVPACVLLAELPLLLAQRDNGESAAQSAFGKRIVGIPKDLVVGFSFPAELFGTIVAALFVAVGIGLVARRTPARERMRALVPGALAVFAVLAPIVLAEGGADYVTARNAIVAVVPGAVCLSAGYASSRAGLVVVSALCAMSLAIGLSASVDTKYGRTDWRGLADAIGPASAPRALVVTPDIDAVLWRIYLPGAEELQDRPVRVREIIVAGLATRGGFSIGPVKPPPATPRTPPPGFKLIGTRLTPTFALIRYQTLLARPVLVSAQKLGGLALVPGASGLFLQRP
jgi:hypothetical protein